MGTRQEKCRTLTSTTFTCSVSLSPPFSWFARPEAPPEPRNRTTAQVPTCIAGGTEHVSFRKVNTQVTYTEPKDPETEDAVDEIVQRFARLGAAERLRAYTLIRDSYRPDELNVAGQTVYGSTMPDQLAD